MTRVELLTRKGCHLCDDAKQALLRLRARHPFELIEIDIDEGYPLPDGGGPGGRESIEATRARYGLEVPVVLIDGRKVAKLRIDEAALSRRLARTGRPLP